MSSILKNTLAFLLVALIVFVSAATPLVLLKQEEKRIVGKTNFYMYETSGEEIEFPSVDVIPTYDEYMVMLSSQKMGRPYVTEPTSEEISIEQAVNRARNELQKLMNAGVIPKNDIRDGAALSDVRYVNYNLESKTSRGFWEVSFSTGTSGGYSVNTAMDAKSGKLLMINISDSLNVLQVNTEESLRGFLEYLGISDKLVTVKSDKNPNFVSFIMADNFVVLSGYCEPHNISIALDITSEGIERVMFSLFNTEQGAVSYENNA